MTSESFIIKHKSAGKFLHVSGDKTEPEEKTSLVIQEGINENMYFCFEHVEGVWGYLKHKASGKIIHPKDGPLNPDNNTSLFIHSNRHAGALFAFDRVNNLIIHKGGKVASPKGSAPEPANETAIVLQDDHNDATKFLFVSPKDTKQEIFLYGKLTVGGRWKIINSLLNPLATHTFTVEYKVGKSKSASKKSSFEFKWETKAEANFFFMTASTSASFTSMVETASSSTWSEENTNTRQITVIPGKSVVTWQYVFFGEQCGNKAEFGSNILADTRSTDQPPKDIASQALGS